MGTSYNPRIVTENLVFCADAANVRSYPKTGTILTDLKGGNNGTLTNMTFANNYSSDNGGVFTFDGSDEYIVFTHNISISEGTFVAWIKRGGHHTNYNGLLFSRGNGGNVTGMNFRSSTNNIGFHWNNGAHSIDSGLTAPLGKWCMATVAVSSSGYVIYLHQSSGFSKYSGSSSHGATNLNSVTIGGDANYSGRNFNGNIGITQIYSRALTADEVRQNYLATKERYA